MIVPQDGHNKWRILWRSFTLHPSRLRKHWEIEDKECEPLNREKSSEIPHSRHATAKENRNPQKFVLLGLGLHKTDSLNCLSWMRKECMGFYYLLLNYRLLLMKSGREVTVFFCVTTDITTRLQSIIPLPQLHRSPCQTQRYANKKHEWENEINMKEGGWREDRGRWVSMRARAIRIYYMHEWSCQWTNLINIYNVLRSNE